MGNEAVVIATIVSIGEGGDFRSSDNSAEITLKEKERQEKLKEQEERQKAEKARLEEENKKLQLKLEEEKERARKKNELAEKNRSSSCC